MDASFGLVTQILRGYTYEQVRTVASVLVGSKVRNVEITLNSDDPYTTLNKISAEFSDSLHIGAGTVLTPDALKRAADAGATFVLSPTMMTKEMLDFCKESEILSIPGAFTPSEIRQCFLDGADIVKVFPAQEVSYAYAAKVLEPLGAHPLMAVGGVTASNVKEVFLGGYSYAGTAGGIFKKKDIIEMNVKALKEELQIFEENLG